MCGIVGYIGNKDVVHTLLEGLELLEYRGYDSAGIAVLNSKGKLFLIKQAGKIRELSEVVKTQNIHGQLGIGHTRWATHGKPTDENAHPHESCASTIALVHNGIIENFYELKLDLINRGHEFTSATDSEVIAHLIEEECKKTNLSFFNAVKEALKKVRGTYALGIMDHQQPDILYAVRSGSPLVIGLGQDENFIASDVTALLKNTRHVIYLEDNQIAILQKSSIEIHDFDGKLVPYQSQEVQWKIEEAQKGGFETFMMKEIFEQPDILRQVLRGRVDLSNFNVQFKELMLGEKEIRDIRRIIIVGCGTAYHAGLCGKYILERYTSIPVDIELASEFRYRDIKVSEGTYVLAISQSGETADTLASIRKAREWGCKILSIVNVVGSTLTRESDSVIYTQAGPEIGVASTKAYLAQLTVFYLLSAFISKTRQESLDGAIQSLLSQLEAIPEKIQSILNEHDVIVDVAKKYCAAHSMFYLGRGFNYPTALEGALKNKEISYMHAEAYAAGEMKHGPIALIDESFPVVCIGTKGRLYEKVLSNMMEVKARNGQIIAVINSQDAHIVEISEDRIVVPETLEELSPLVNIVALQLLAYYIARDRGCDIDKPRNLAKCVTVE